MYNNLRIQIFNEGHYRLGDDITISLSISNQGNNTYNLELPVISSGQLKSDIFSVVSDGFSCRYEGLFVKTLASYVSLFAHETIEFSVSLAKEYYMSAEGSYHISTSFFRYLTKESNISSTFYLSPGTSPAITWSELALETITAKRAYKKFDSHYVFGGTDKDFDTVKIAHYKAVEALNYISKHFNSGTDIVPEIFSQNYDKLFCHKICKANNTLDKFKVMHNYMASSLQYDFEGIYCSPSIYAYVLTDDPNKNIFLCGIYKQSSTYPSNKTPYDTKAGVIIHEISHKATHSKDYYYGETNCLKSARLCNLDEPSCDNADCLQIFAELTLLGAQDNAQMDEL